MLISSIRFLFIKSSIEFYGFNFTYFELNLEKLTKGVADTFS